MNDNDSEETALRESFAARLEAAPEPAPSMHERTMRLIDDRSGARKTPAAWLRFAAPPARWATAAVVVVIGGTVIAQSFRHTPALRPPPQTVVLQPDAGTSQTIRLPVVRSGEMRLIVNNIPVAFERLQVLVKGKNGALPRTVARSHSLEATFMVEPERLAATMHSVASLGHVRSQSQREENVADALRDRRNQVRVLQQEAALLRAPSGSESVELRDVRSRLSLAQARLQSLSQSTAVSALHITLTQS